MQVAFEKKTGHFYQKTGHFYKGEPILIPYMHHYAICVVIGPVLNLQESRDLRSVVADSGPINRFGVWTQPVMYGSLEPRDFKANSKHNGKSKHDSLFTDLP